MSRPLRVGITSFASQGGSGVVATELGLALARREDFQIHFISHAQPPRLSAFTPNLFFHEVETSSYPPFPHAPYSLALASKMTEVATYHDLDVLHVHYAIPHAASSYLAKQMLAPRAVATITTLHGTDITLVGREPGFFPLTKFSIEQSDCVTAVSQFLAKETRDVFEVDREIRVIPNFVDTAVFVPRPDLREQNPLRRGSESVLLHVSNLRPVKNIPALVRGFARIRAERQVRLVVVGEGPERRPAEDLACELGVGDDVLFLGNQESMSELMAMADVLLLPSEHESFGLVALEAMSCGTPVVASHRGGIPEVVEDGRHGFLHDPQDVEAMAAHVLRILADRELAERLGEQARADARAKFCIRCVLDDYVELYRSEAARVGRAAG